MRLGVDCLNLSNIIVSLITLTISIIVPKNGLEKIANIVLKIFDDVYPEHLLVYLIRQFWLVIIVVFERWIFIGKVFYIFHLLERLIQLIISL